MNYLPHISKGILIGIANIVPGVSGGTLAVSMGIYHNIIHAVTHFFIEPKKSMKTLLPYGIGAFTGMIGLSFAIEYLFAYYSLQTSLVFIGLILGGLPELFSQIPHKQVQISGYLVFLLTCSIIIGMAFIGGGSSTSADLGVYPGSVIKLFFAGIIAAATMVIPGVSGSMILMLLGYYHPIIASINQVMIGVTAADITVIRSSCAILIPFGLGITVGVFACAHMIEILLSHYEVLTYCAMIGLVLSSPVIILLGISPSILSIENIGSGLVCFILSFTLAVWLARKKTTER